jgi:hypothetical protein
MGLVGCFAVAEDVRNMQDGNRVGTAVELTNTQCKSGDSGHAEAKNNAAIPPSKFILPNPKANQRRTRR